MCRVLLSWVFKPLLRSVSTRSTVCGEKTDQRTRCTVRTRSRGVHTYGSFLKSQNAVCPKRRTREKENRHHAPAVYAIETTHSPYCARVIRAHTRRTASLYPPPRPPASSPLCVCANRVAPCRYDVYTYTYTRTTHNTRTHANVCLTRMPVYRRHVHVHRSLRFLVAHAGV